MTEQFHKGIAAIILFALGGIAFTQNGYSQQNCGYTIETLEPMCLGSNVGKAVGDGGHLTGFFGCGLSGNDFGYLWYKDVVDVFELPPGFTGSRGLAANAQGEVAGYIQKPNWDQHAFIYSQGTLIDLPPLAGETIAQGLGIAPNAPIVVGYSHDTQVGPPKAVMWQDGKVSQLEVPEPSWAEDINAIHQIVGWTGNFSISRAFIWDKGVVTYLSVIPEGTSSRGYAINDRGDVVGRGRVPDPNIQGRFFVRAFLYADGVMINLDSCSGFAESSAQDINNKRQIVGWCQQSSDLIGFIWEDGLFTPLNDLVVGLGDLSISIGNSINQAGQIAGYAEDSNQTVAILLTPIPTTPGDTNCDKLVNVDDLLAVINHWGTCAKFTPCPGDLDDNDSVDVDDLLIIINNWSG